MAPVPSATRLPHDMYLILTFPSFASLSTVHPAAFTTAIAAAARRCSSLLVIVRFSQSNSSPWSATTADSSSGCSSSTAAALPRASATSSPAQAWVQLEVFLAQAYGAATKVFLSEERVLDTVDVVIEEMRQLAMCVPSGVEVQRVEVELGAGEEGQKGKGKREGLSRSSLGQSGAEESSSGSSFEVTAMGGTFDHLHAGHKILLSIAASITTRKLIVGVTDEALLVNKKHHDYLESLSQRMDHVRSYLELVRPGIEHEIVPISDPFGPTAHVADIQALVVSEETRAGGDAINTKRTSLSPSLGSLEIFVIELMADDADTEAVEGTVDVAKKMGSTGIRAWLAGREQGAGTA